MGSKTLDELMRVLPEMQREIIKRFISDPLIKGTITIQQMILMEILSPNKAVTVTDIAKAMTITKSAVTGLSDRLVKSSLISRKRGADDRRVVLIVLTSKGRRLIENVVAKKHAFIRKIFTCLTESEQKVYLKLVRKIFGYIAGMSNEK